ncbi:O-antigen polymerase [Calothrix sp. NIES-2098]|uniref:O-antigen polymerase n=1 Tax=Calothrix sp. NIES-2098 TaxID=1954171 RepID=UPI000B6085F0|nr:hypothetical protein NIES2098_60660 [Calothrix sp. NIES-2098]
MLINNPYFLYIISFAISITIYSFGWSEIYPPFSLSLLSFLGLTFVVSFILGFRLLKHKEEKLTNLPYDYKILYIIALIYFLSAIEVILYPDIPILQVFQGIEAGNNEYGIPLLHPLIMSLSTFYAIYVFHVYLSHRKRKFLLYHLSLYLPIFIFFSRGTIVVILIAIAFVFLFTNTLKIKNIVYILIAITILLYLFGWMGNIRVPGNEEFILIFGGASQSFKESLIPKEYFWSYLYISSPIANLQNNIDANIDGPINYEYFLFFVREIMPRFLSKYITQDYADQDLINPALTTGTMYAQAYSFLGWAGMIIIYIYMIFLIKVTLNLLRRVSGVFYVTGFSILNTMILLNVFDNMLVFSGTFLPLCYVFIFGYIYKLIQ